MFLLPVMAVAQAPVQGPQPAAGQAEAGSEGVATEWDVQKLTAGIAQQAREVASVLSAAKPEKWTELGAPEAYVRQLRSTQNEAAALIRSADLLARDPEKMTAALDTYFVMLDMEQLGGSLANGLRKYQSVAVGDRLAQELGATAAFRAKLREHITSLAAVREEEFQVMNQEAQRCRGMISRQSEPATGTRRMRNRGARP